KTTDYFIEGLQFGFKIFGPVIPIAALFYLGDSGFVKIIGDYLPKGSHGIITALGSALSPPVPGTQDVAAGTVTIVGVI
ncbi:MFS transporter, partial [Bacillus cereus]|nr:MFS transporter [Bacillus cereus]